MGLDISLSKREKNIKYGQVEEEVGYWRKYYEMTYAVSKVCKSVGDYEYIVAKEDLPLIISNLKENEFEENEKFHYTVELFDQLTAHFDFEKYELIIDFSY